jgi:predicted alpha/beta hydrolase family esterase
VRYPDLPDPLEPQPQDWLALLREELAAMEGERVVLCHSLGCLLWMLFAAECPRVAADRVLLVAPPCDWSIPAIGRFRPNRTDQKTLDAAARETLVLWADPDPYCPGGALRAFAGAFSNAVEIDGGGHLNTDAGYGAWPAIERWALSGDFA